jgi:hypothetical protein
MDVDDVRLTVAFCGPQSKVADRLKGYEAEDRLFRGGLLGRRRAPQSCDEDDTQNTRGAL